MQTAQVLDARGLNCPLPILRTKKALNALRSGETVKVVSTDPGSLKDMTSFCEQTGNSPEVSPRNPKWRQSFI